MDEQDKAEMIEDLQRVLRDLEAPLPTDPVAERDELLALRSRALIVISATLIALSE